MTFYAALTLDFQKAATTIGLPGATTDAPNVAFGTLIGTVLGIIMVIALLILLLYLILGALEWMASAGETSKLQSARNRMMHAVIGIIILSSVLAVFMLVQYVMGVEFINFKGTSQTAVEGTCQGGLPETCISE